LRQREKELMTRVLISGGIAGLTLAYWLHRYRISPVVIEQAAGLQHDGYGIDFFGTGYDIATRMGGIERLRGQQFPPGRDPLCQSCRKASGNAEHCSHAQHDGRQVPGWTPAERVKERAWQSKSLCAHQPFRSVRSASDAQAFPV